MLNYINPNDDCSVPVAVGTPIADLLDGLDANALRALVHRLIDAKPTLADIIDDLCGPGSAITATGNAAVPSVPLRRIDRPAASPAPARIRTESRRSVHLVHRPRPTPPKTARNPVTHLFNKPYISTLFIKHGCGNPPGDQGTAAPTAIRHSSGRGRAPKTQADKATAHPPFQSTSTFVATINHARHATIGETLSG